ncbi:AfsR/SARP family transcriptional regulator [Plantactinospora sp. DSM 117369]
MNVHVRLLGPVEIVRDGVAATLGPPKQRTAAVMLLVHANQPVSIGRLVNEVWPDEPPPSAVANIRTYLNRLRALCRDSPALSVRRCTGGYALDAVPDAVDLDLFATRTACGDVALDKGDIAAAATQYAAALDLWRGEPFEGVPLGPVLDAARAELSERRNAVVERHAELRLRLGDAASIVAPLRRQVVAEPLRESGWRLLAIALWLSGNPAAALETLGDARAVLAEELGVSPGPALRELYRAVVSGDDAAVRANVGPASPGMVEHEADPIRALVAQLAHELGMLPLPGILIANSGRQGSSGVSHPHGRGRVPGRASAATRSCDARQARRPDHRPVADGAESGCSRDSSPARRGC